MFTNLPTCLNNDVPISKFLGFIKLFKTNLIIQYRLINPCSHAVIGTIIRIYVLYLYIMQSSKNVLH